MSEAIVPMAHGEMPSGSGWYVLENEEARFVAEIVQDQGHHWFMPSRLRVLESDRFIARIYPDRIEGREG